MGAEVIFVFGHPIAIVLAIATIVLVSYLTYDNLSSVPIKPKRLIRGYLAALAVCFLLALLYSFSSERPKDVVFNIFFFSYVSLFGIALVGVPSITALANITKVTIPSVLVLATTISFLTCGLLLWTDKSYFQWGSAIELVSMLVAFHLCVCLGFCLGAGIPWSAAQHTSKA